MIRKLLVLFGLLWATSAAAAINTQNGPTYTLATSDSGQEVDLTHGGAVILTVPDVTMPGFGSGFSTMICAGQLSNIVFKNVDGGSASVNGRPMPSESAGPTECMTLAADGVSNNYKLLRLSPIVDHSTSWVGTVNPSPAGVFRADHPMLITKVVGDINAPLNGSGDAVKAYIVGAAKGCTALGAPVLSGAFNVNAAPGEYALPIAKTNGYAGLMVPPGSRVCLMTSGSDWGGSASSAEIHFYARTL